MFHSWNVGPVHFVSINSEAYYAPSFDETCEQYEWLHQDLQVMFENVFPTCGCQNFYSNLLKVANTPVARQERPWIIVYAHRPMYCSNTDLPCIENEIRLRTGVPGTQV